ncbi:hypothetical protein ACQP3L_35480, partial [Escherichia coli]
FKGRAVLISCIPIFVPRNSQKSNPTLVLISWAIKEQRRQNPLLLLHFPSSWGFQESFEASGKIIQPMT